MSHLTSQTVHSHIKRSLKSAIYAAFFTAFMVGSAASATTLDYDTSTAVGYQGGNSLWDTVTTSDWTVDGSDGTTLSTWNAGSGTDAVFASTLSAGANVSVVSAISVNSINIAMSSMQFSNGGGGSLTLGSGGLTISGNGYLTINSPNFLQGTGGVALTSTGATALFTANENYTGQVQIQKGILTAYTLANFNSASSLGQGTVGTSIVLGSVGDSVNRGLLSLSLATSSTTNRTFSLAAGGLGTISVISTSKGATLTGVIDGGSSTSVMVFSENTSAVATGITLSAQNTYQGVTRIQTSTSGTSDVQLGTTNALPSGTVLNLSDNSNSGYSGLLDLNGYDQQVAGLVRSAGSGTAAANIRVFNSSATLSTLTLNIASGTNNYVGIIGSGSGNNLALTQTGAGTLILSNVNTYTGGTTVSAGQITSTVAGALGSTTGALTMAGGTLDLNALPQTVGAVSITAAAGSGNTIQNGTLIGTSFAASNTTGNAIVSAILAGDVTLTKSGAGGTLTLSAANTYTGLTTLSAGTLILAVSGSFDYSSGVNLGTAGSHGTLDLTSKASFNFGSAQSVTGFGTINIGSGKTVTIAGTFGPGNSPGQVNVTGNLALAGTTASTFELAGNGTVKGADFDNATATGTMGYAGTLSIVSFGGYNIDTNINLTYSLFDFTGGYTGNFSGVTVAGTALVFDSGTNTWGASNGGNTAHYTFSLATGGLTVAPEPSIWALLAFSLTTVMVLRRRQS